MSEQITLRAEKGRPTGSAAARRIRNEGNVPAIVYGKDVDEPILITVDRRELRAALTTDAGLNALISLEIDGDQQLALAREVETHPYKTEIRHVDFVTVGLTDTIVTDVQLEFLGEPIATEEGGVLSTPFNTVSIEVLATNIPSVIQIDVSEMTMTDSLRISDLPQLEGVSYLDDPELTIATIVIPRALIEEEEEEAAELLEGEEGELLEEGEEAEGDEAAAEGEAEEGSEEG